MSTSIRMRQDQAGNLSGTVYEMHCGPARAEVWPFAGFNCLRWTIDGKNVLYSAPDWSTNPVPTRSGHPILFPFPNRLAHGKLNANGIDYQLPLTEATRTHAIHGFTARSPWRVVDSGASGGSAFVTACFRMSEQFENAASLWPSDGSLTLTYSLSETSLRVEAVVENWATRICRMVWVITAIFGRPWPRMRKRSMAGCFNVK
ncbi:MAG: aldose 1-epimerase [Gemmataceae bacterium]